LAGTNSDGDAMGRLKPAVPGAVIWTADFSRQLRSGELQAG
jgi:hypothetical protein